MFNTDQRSSVGVEHPRRSASRARFRVRLDGALDESRRIAGHVGMALPLKVAQLALQLLVRHVGQVALRNLHFVLLAPKPARAFIQKIAAATFLSTVAVWNSD